MNRSSSFQSLALLISLAAAPVFAGQEPATKPEDKSSSVPADNTKVNKRDRKEGAMTADQQSNRKADRELTQKIRRALVEDKQLSTYAHNVKVIAKNGEVTLKGPVRSEEEKKAVEAKAAEVAGGATIRNELQVAPKDTKESKKKDATS